MGRPVHPCIHKIGCLLDIYPSFRKLFLWVVGQLHAARLYCRHREMRLRPGICSRASIGDIIRLSRIATNN